MKAAGPHTFANRTTRGQQPRYRRIIPYEYA